jgi:replicative DNA helicase
MNNKMLDREINKAGNEILNDKYKTALKKAQLINELKSGLGSEIKKNPNKAKFIKKTWYERFMDTIKKIFTKF